MTSLLTALIMYNQHSFLSLLHTFRPPLPLLFAWYNCN